MKKSKTAIIALFLILGATLQTQGAPQVPRVTFKDVTQNTVYSSDILDVAGRGIMQGYDDGSFHPNTLITRAEFIKTLLTAAQCRDCTKQKEPTETEPFVDVPPSSWYFPCVTQAKRLGLITGYLGDFQKGLFAPDAPISRSESIVLLLRANGITPDENSPVLLYDIPPRSWYASYMKTAVENGILPYHNGYVAPEEKVSRAEIAHLLRAVLKDALCQQVEQSPSDTDGDGILDQDDACPTITGPVSNNGCPISANNNINSLGKIQDRDGDTIPDNEDVCPNIPGDLQNATMVDGCPFTRQQAPLDSQPGLTIGFGDCTSCPCPSADYRADIRRGDVLFGIIQDSVSKTIYTTSNMYYIGK